MKYKYIYSLIFCGLLSLVSCNNHKTIAVNSNNEEETNRVYPPISLYFMKANSMVVSVGAMGEDYTAYLPDFVSYPNDLTKLGLKGPVKYCEMGASTIKWTFDFNTDGNLTNQQFRMDSQGRYGEGHRMEYNGAGELTFLGRDFRGQSPDSHTYTYENGVLVKREYGSGMRTYEWKKDSNGKLDPIKSVTKGLKPLMDMTYAESDAGVVLHSMLYANPWLPGGLAADKGMSTFEYDSDGRLMKISVCYFGCKNAPAKDLYGVNLYEYNEHGDVSKETYSLAKTADQCLTDNALHTQVTTYDYNYDEHDNWIWCKSTSSRGNEVSLPVSRTIQYYSEEELETIAAEKKYVEEHPFIGQWRLNETEEFEKEDGDKEVIKYSGKLVLNLYEKFVPDGHEGENPVFGILYVESVPQYGMEQVGSYTITKAKLNGNDVDILLVGYFSGIEYSGKLTYSETDRSIKISDIKFLKEPNNESESDFDGYDYEPIEGVYKFYKSDTINK